MGECFGKYYILNGSLRSAETFNNSLIYEGESVYEVLRMVGGLPVFFSDHAERLQASVNIAGKPLLSDNNSLINDLLRLSSEEKKEMINLKIVFNYKNGRNNCLLYYLEPHYPTDELYNQGVKGILFRAERKDPESKVINQKLRSEINMKLDLENGYEALLVNRDDCITEGSRTNIFFIADSKLFTAPGGSVLNGITRKYLLEICREIKMEVVLGSVNADEISCYESVFMTGTTPIVLPFHSVNDIKFNVKHPFIAQLRNLYLAKAEESIKSFIKD